MYCASERPKRILQVVGAMNRGGVETWLMHMLRNIDRSTYQIDFLKHSDIPSHYDEEILSLGSQIRVCPYQRYTDLPSYQHKLRTIFRETQYDVVHGHVQSFNAISLRAAASENVPIRIAHSHSADISHQSNTLWRKSYIHITNYWINKYMTHGIAVSHEAAKSLFGTKWEQDARVHISYCGIDLAPFQTQVNRNDLRKMFHIPGDALVMGHVGRFVESKNHTLLIQIAKKCSEAVPNFRLVLIGDGSLKSEMEQLVKQLGLETKTLFLGVRDDIPNLLMGLMDVFVLPSLFEGLPLAGIEAQAAGLPLVISDSITKEMDILTSSITRLSPMMPPEIWSQAVIQTWHGHRNKESYMPMVLASPFNIHHSLRNLMSYYQGG